MLNTRTKALAALIFTGILGGIGPIFMKIALREITPFQITFTRFFCALLILVPIGFFKNQLTFKMRDITFLLLSSLLFSGNILLFVIGLQYTTSIASQLLYLLLPTLVIIWSYLFLKHRIESKHIISIVAGFAGGAILILKDGNTGLLQSLGTAKGNLIILGGVISWSLYLVVSKKLSSKYSPLSLLIINSLMVSVISALFLYMENDINPALYFHISLPALLSLAFLAVGNSVLFFFLYQWILKHIKPFSVSLSAYLGPLSAAMVAIPLLGEQLSTQLILSGLLIGISSYLTFRKK